MTALMISVRTQPSLDPVASICYSGNALRTYCMPDAFKGDVVGRQRIIIGQITNIISKYSVRWCKLMKTIQLSKEKNDIGAEYT